MPRIPECLIIERQLHTARPRFEARSADHGKYPGSPLRAARYSILTQRSKTMEICCRGRSVEEERK